MLCNKHLFCSAGFGEREIRLSARTGEFTRVSGACNGEFGGAAVSHVAHFVFKITLLQAIMLTLLLVCSFSPKVQSIFWGPRYIDCARISLLTAKNPTETSGFFGGEREIRLTAGTSEFTRVSGACNGEFGGAAVVCNQCLFDCTESLF